MSIELIPTHQVETVFGLSTRHGKEWPERKKERHRKYMAEWRKNPINHSNQLKANSRAAKKYRPTWYKKFMAKHSATKLTLRSRLSEKTATMARQPWSELDEAMLASETTSFELAKKLGRSVRSIQHRKHKLRGEES